MAVFNLDKFPDVCRVCMKPETKDLMQPLDKNLASGKQNIADFLDEITFAVSKEKIKILPKMICSDCLKELDRFDTYRNRLVLTLRFMEALLDLKESNSKPLSALFKKSKRELNTLFKDLALSNKEEPRFEDLLDEFETYDLASYGEEVKIKVESQEQEPKAEEDFTIPDDDDPDDDPDFECGVDNNNSDSDSGQDMKPEVVYAEILDEDSSGKNKSGTRSVSTTRKRGKSKTSATTENSSVRKRKTRVKNASESDEEQNTTSKSKEKNSTRPRGRPRIHPDGTFLKEPWCCDKCKFTTKYRTAIERHKGVHEKRENRTYPCNECEKAFKTYDEMRTHSLSHPENQVVCEICGAALRNSYSLKAHMERHEDSRKYSCEYCDYTSNTNLSLKAHMTIHTKTNWSKRCEICGIVFRTASRLKRHMESHSNERKYACDQCPGRFNTTNALRNHRTRVHLAIRHACDHCDKTYDQKIALRDHIERIHHIQCTFICDICVATFDNQERLETHKVRHINPKPMECSVCLTLHKDQESFNGHLCITYQDDYLCCNKDLRNHLQYNKHMQVKHGLTTNARVKPVPGMLLGQLRGARKRLEQCRKCDIAFPSRALKLQHMAICNQLQQEVPMGEGDVDTVSSY